MSDGKTDTTKGEKPKDAENGKTDTTKGEKPKDAEKPKAGSVSVRTENPKRFGHPACYGLTFNPTPTTFAPGELAADALTRLKADPLLVVTEH